jgi:hypothetical protein
VNAHKQKHRKRDDITNFPPEYDATLYTHRNLTDDTGGVLFDLLTRAYDARATPNKENANDRASATKS